MVSIAGVSEQLSVVVLGLMANLPVEHRVAWRVLGKDGGDVR